MPTLDDIAESIGLSRATVSHVLKGRSEKMRISPETAQKVLDAASKLGYIPNESARSIKRGYAKVISYAAPLIWPQFVSWYVEGAALEADRQEILMHIIPWTLVDDYRKAVDSALRQRPMGFIMQSADNEHTDYIFKRCSAEGIPLVSVDASSSVHPEVRRIISDDESGAAMAVDHLVGLGHRRIAVLSREWMGSSQNPELFPLMRENGFIKAMKKHGLDVLPEHLINGGSDEKISSAIDSLLLSGKPFPTAFFCVTDMLAMNLMKVLQKRGISIPEKVSVVGFGEMMMAAYSNPGLTTVKQPYREMGAAAVRRIIEIRAGKKVASTDEFHPVSLVLRESTASPAL